MTLFCFAVMLALAPISVPADAPAVATPAVRRWDATPKMADALADDAIPASVRA